MLPTLIPTLITGTDRSSGKLILTTYGHHTASTVIVKERHGPLT